MRKAFVFLMAAAAVAQWREVKPEEEPALFRSDVNLVRVDAEVLMGNRAITGLKAKDFQLFDNGAPRELSGFYAENAPLDLLLVFDVSGSMRPVVEKVAQSATRALAQLRDGDRVGVLYFTTTTTVAMPLSKDHDAVVAAIEERVLTQPFSGGTHLLDAIADGAIEFMREKPGDRRRAIVVITDNKGQRTRSEDSVIRLLWEADATATGLIVDSPADSMPATFPRSRRGIIWSPSGTVMNSLMSVGMNKVAEQSGGDIVATDQPGDAFAILVERLRSRYGLYYSMPEGTPGERRQIRVELAGSSKERFPSATVKARRGYMIPDGSAPPATPAATRTRR